jgi:hypothetical protein
MNEQFAGEPSDQAQVQDLSTGGGASSGGSAAAPRPRGRKLRWSDWLLVAAGLALGVSLSVSNTASVVFVVLFFILGVINAVIYTVRAIRNRGSRRRP